MRKLVVFNHTSLDGYFVDAKGDMSFAHNKSRDAEWDAFVERNASGGGVLLFGRVTYQLMASFWPTPLAAETMPAMANRMNLLPKVVFSRTLDTVAWSNTKLVKGDLIAEVRQMRQEPGDDIVILGSGSLVPQLASHGLIDGYQIVVNPVALGEGRTLFEGLEAKLPLKLTNTRAFNNGNVLLSYEPAM